MKIGIIGLGLIGGSFAIAAKKHISPSKLFGNDRNLENEKKALELGLIDEILKKSDFFQMDVILLAIPVDAALDLINDLLDQINDNTLLIDVGSTKSMICEKVAFHPKRNQFLATHPIAGTEFSGPTAAFDSLFIGKSQILCETNKTRPDLLEWAVSWFKNINMRLREMDPKEHDKHIAYVSHLSHISSFMLGKTVMEKEKDEKTIFDMAGSGFESTVRLAKSSPDMWAPIFEQNKENVLEILSAYIKNLEDFKSKLAADAIDDLHQQMKNTNQLKTILNGIKHNN